MFLWAIFLILRKMHIFRRRVTEILLLKIVQSKRRYVLFWANVDLGGGFSDLQKLFWEPYFKVPLFSLKFWGKKNPPFIEENFVIFFYPKLIYALKVPKRQIFCKLDFVRLIFRYILHSAYSTFCFVFLVFGKLSIHKIRKIMLLR